MLPLRHHWYEGALPPLLSDTVKVAVSPAQMLEFGVLMLAVGVTGGFTVMLNVLLLPELVPQLLILLTVHVIWSPLTQLELLYVLLLLPTLLPFFFH